MESVVEVIKFAIKNEVRAEVFYRKAADLSNAGESQMVFMELVEMESSHAQHLVDKFGAIMQAEGVDAEAYLAGLVSDVEKTLDADQIKLLENAEMRPVIDFAIDMEAKARDNYLELAKHMENDELVKLCQEMADEEQEHFDLLTAARVGTDTPSEDRPAL